MENKDISNLKGIVLAGGAGTRLHPLTKVTSKQLLPIYNRPMIYFPLSTLINVGIKEILIITTPEDSEKFNSLLKDGSQWGVQITYEVQKSPDGIAQALIIAEEFLDNKDCILILGDNLFYGPDLSNKIAQAYQRNSGATIFGYEVQDPERYGVIDFKDNKVLSIEEKPLSPKSNYVATGLYIYDKEVTKLAKILKPSERGELEITDLNLMYLKDNNLKLQFLDSEYSWLDTGTFDALLEASIFIRDVEKALGKPITVIS